MGTNSFATLLLTVLATTLRSYGQQVILYDNHFESPNQMPVPNCGSDLDATDLNTLWSGTAEGTGGGGAFQQVNTVETILINGPDERYDDPSGNGGNYCISMLSTYQDDRAAVTLNSQLLPYCIVSFDISAIDLDACGGPFGLDTPVMNIKIYDSPGGVFEFSNPGTILDEDTISGTAPGSTVYTFNWRSQWVSMDIENSADGNITVVFDLQRSGYAAIDNLLIFSSITGIYEAGFPEEVALVPNPASWELIIRGLMEPADRIVITDLCGRVLKICGQSTARPIDISGLPSGHYIVNIPSPGSMIAKKLIIAHQ